MQNLTEVLNGTSSDNSSDLALSTSTVSTSTIAETTTTTSEELSLTTFVTASDHSTATSIAFISLVVFGVACALIAKIVISHRKKRAELIGSARWRISASRQSASSASSGGNGGSATYLQMGRGGNNRSLNNQRQPLNSPLDHPTADRLDWERQFFDDSEATTPSRLVFR
ncbi:Protein CBG05811 [Caenorhabditis briggsae]|uniref:Uncharacterized protein n=2 Tax=Caenorhabditis briggsae TaxID=6238 RepID=A0AAE9D4K3_CAEBR|nr:Protein CBG05811 [Caenorhabditis briggsae]ULT95026.1 hypothetical protein L3Y34_004042 [Caenorhabditis briggsae]UMM28234.1 hypothetical protein L5515_011162 [Caenorhabditis briggsae]CAP26516.2 Protein CBG05811 [Caenorhabditis briggsae]